MKIKRYVIRALTAAICAAAFASCVQDESANEEVADRIKWMEDFYPAPEQWRDDVLEAIRSDSWLYTLSSVDKLKSYNKINMSWGGLKSVLSEKERDEIKSEAARILKSMGVKRSPKATASITIQPFVVQNKNWPVIIHMTQIEVNETAKILREGKEVFHGNAISYSCEHFGALPANTPKTPKELISFNIRECFDKMRKDRN